MCLALAMPACVGTLGADVEDAAHDAAARDGATVDVPMILLDAATTDVRAMDASVVDVRDVVDVPPPPVDHGPPDRCATVHCNTGAACNPTTGTCACVAPYTGDGTTCTRPAPSDPAMRSRDDVCARWTADRVLRATRTWTAGTTGACDPGTIDPAANADGFRVLNVYRWLSGLAPAAVEASLAAPLQQCALMEGLSGTLSHMPPTSWRCYTAAGAGQAGMSNLAAGTRMTPASAVDLWVNETAQDLGHARWCLSPPLGPTNFGSTDTATCMNSFSATPGGAVPPWVAYPNQGPAPFENTQGVWHAQDGTVSVAGRTVEMRDVATNAVLATTPVSATLNYGNSSAVAWRPNGWTPAADATYRVTLSGGSGPVITYTVTPVRCP